MEFHLLLAFGHLEQARMFKTQRQAHTGEDDGEDPAKVLVSLLKHDRVEEKGGHVSIKPSLAERIASGYFEFYIANLLLRPLKFSSLSL
jgi:hypothetical protein